MRVLVCDDDATIRTLVKRTIEERFGCRVQECADGVEALDALSKATYSFVILDGDMPGLNGLQTLEEIRAAESTRHLPVVMLSGERDERTVQGLLKLGVSHYLLKPLRLALLQDRLDHLVSRLPKSSSNAGEIRALQMTPEHPVLVVEGNLDFRFFFARVAEKFGPVVQADSGAAALAAFQRSPVDVVFIGSDLGVVVAERLSEKLRQARPSGVRLVRVVDAGEEDSVSSADFDDVLVRSYVPETFQRALRPFVSIPGPLTSLCGVVPGLPDLVVSGARQVFGMMFEADVRTVSTPPASANAFLARMDMKIADRFEVDFGIFLSAEATKAAGTRMLGMPADELIDEDLQSVAGELANLLAGRLHAHFRERSLASVVGLPKLGANEAPPVVSEVDGLSEVFSIPGAGEFVVSMVVRDMLEVLGDTPAELLPGAEASTEVEASASPAL